MSACTRRSQRASRLWFAMAVGAAGFALLSGCGDGAAVQREKRVIVLGFDGMDYTLTRQLMDAGRMPHFKRLADAGLFTPLETSVPPQSPVAWSNFITGMDAGGHGIFDFIHRDPKTMVPYLSTSKTEPGRSLRLGKWRVPLSPGKIVLLRHGTAFWEKLKRRGIETTIMRAPANFPPGGTATRELSGMGTPDILGTYGTFTFYSSDATASVAGPVGGGRIDAGAPADGVFHGVLHGPNNPYRSEPREATAGFELYLDPDKPMAKLVVGRSERVLAQGEWSDWLPVEFPLAPTRTLRGMCRFYLKQLRPTFQLYVTPINLDPLDPALPISAPDSWAPELAEATGRFYTQGMPEDTKAYAAGVFDPHEFLTQARIAGEESLGQYRYVLGGFHRGLLFYYFGDVDQTSHVMWRPMDPGHPAYDAATDAPLADVVHGVYEQMDAIVGYTVAQMDSNTLLIVMSDHGFASWRRAFHLNAWLHENGYLAVRNPDLQDNTGMLTNVDWARTRAYGLGLNGLYVNSTGRERWGIVPAVERDALLREISAKLLETHDPATDMPVITRVYRSDEWYRERDHLEIGPDLIVGYAKGTRCSDESAIGMVEAQVFSDNTHAWSGDHCMDHTTVPGILLANRPLRQPARSLRELGSAILAEFGLGSAGAAAHVAAAQVGASGGIQR